MSLHWSPHEESVAGAGNSRGAGWHVFESQTGAAEHPGRNVMWRATGRSISACGRMVAGMAGFLPRTRPLLSCPVA